MNKDLLPQYLEPVHETDQYYGTLTIKDGTMTISGEPYMIDMAKRIFPGERYSRGGVISLPTHPRFVGDVNWLMMRYPLKVETQDSERSWEDVYEETVQYHKKLYAIDDDVQSMDISPAFRHDLLPYQKKGVEFMQNSRRCLLADEMGLGKTAQALALVANVSRWPVLIVTPPHLMSQWEDETDKFLGEDVKVHKIQGMKPYDLPKAHVYVIHYLLLRTWGDFLCKNLETDMIVFDEIQDLRHDTSKKYANSGKLLSNLNPRYVIGLSGTPMYNYGIEIFNIMNLLEEGCLGTKEYFKREWGEPFSPHIVREPDKLGSFLYSKGLMLRRRKEDVLQDLPEKLRSVQHVDSDGNVYERVKSEEGRKLFNLPTKPSRERTMMMLEAERNLRRASGISKAGNVIEFVKYLLENQEPTILFAFHKDVMKMYEKGLSKYDPVFVTGNETSLEKKKNVTAFMRGTTDLIIVNLRTTAGLNLQRARCVVFGELDWSPSVHAQAEDRAHRINQKQNVLAYYLTSDNEIDEYMLSVLGLKREQFTGVMHDKEVSEEDERSQEQVANQFMWQLIEKIKNPSG